MCLQYPDDQSFALFAEADPVSGSEVDRALIHPGADPFDLREIALLKAVQGGCDACGGLSVQAVEPARKRRVASRIQVFSDRDTIA